MESNDLFVQVLSILSNDVNFRAIKDFMAGKAKGSTGRPPWWTLSTREQKEFLGKKV
jgi:hypothetical protein